MTTLTNRLVLKLISFDQAQVRTEAQQLVADINDELVPAALAVASGRAASQDTTVGNVRTRATGVLSVAALVVTFLSSVGLLAGDTSHGGHRFHVGVAWALVGILIVLALATSLVQLPMQWTLDSGTEAFRGKTQLAGQRAALETLEIGLERNNQQITLLLRTYVFCLSLLAVEVVLVTIDLALQ